jgi:hypothetical protein
VWHRDGSSYQVLIGQQVHEILLILGLDKPVLPWQGTMRKQCAVNEWRKGSSNRISQQNGSVRLIPVSLFIKVARAVLKR